MIDDNITRTYVTRPSHYLHAYKMRFADKEISMYTKDVYVHTTLADRRT